MKKNYLGLPATDRITGFKGIVTGFVQYITGCNQCLVAPPTKDGAELASAWFDVQRLEFGREQDRIKLPEAAAPSTTGFDRPAPKR